ncbi:hypothetical protein [Brevibacillus aydinogluensis]|uniref:HARE-HTH domain-containing protein n=1 Tax=Brevibacillus aydinogluensis TaxID=927786 RepID=A0AA48RH45_9BACL|nr:hypothetical protein [Brevibacillus aydinogluensis]CAJ1002237.1 HARE-HTH domain-containing protein [Brevibacillus aydinogluensis]
MSTTNNERQALQMTLQFLLEQRVSIRKEYLQRDKELAEEIKQLLHRIRQLDEQFGVPSGMDDQQGGTTIGTAVPVEMSAKRAGRVRRPYQHHDYPRIAREVEAILEEATAPLTLTQLYGELQKHQGFEWPHPYIIIQKALKYSERVQVQKEGRKLMFSIVK